ncbi:MAG: glycosyltransferase, partial [Flavitalea sp.]
NWIGNKKIFDFFNHINNARLAKVIDEASERLGFIDPVVFIDNDFIRYVELPALLKNKEGVIYYIRDYLNSQDYFRKHGKRLEPKLIKDATVVTANSAYLQEYAENYRAKAWDIGQGCEFDFIPEAEVPKPADLEPVKGPIIGYTGAIVSMRLDERLMLQLAEENPAWNFVLVGPVDEVFRNSRLNGLKNVWFLGTKKGSELPAYIYHFDVCINPQVLNEMTIGNYPRKVDEYLAMGKPVVATKTRAMEMFKDFVYLCENAAEYQAAIRKSLEENAPEKQERRKQFALTHTWENSVKKLYNAYAASK